MSVHIRARATAPSGTAQAPARDPWLEILKLNRRALPIWPQTRACVTASSWRMWFRSWWTHSPSSSSTRSSPTSGCRPRGQGPRCRGCARAPIPRRAATRTRPRGRLRRAGGRVASRRRPAGPNPRGRAGWPGTAAGAARHDRPDPAGESAPLGLDEVPDALVRAPLPGLRPPAALGAERAQLGDDDRRRRGEQVGDARRGEPSIAGLRLGHGDRSSAGAAAVPRPGGRGSRAARP